MKFPALFDPAHEGGFTVTFRDLPEAITEGETLEEAEDEIGISDWIDPETGQPGEASFRLEN